MENDKIVQLLQYRRHDLVNDMQVIHGYASMQMFDKVQEKLDEFMIATEHERKLHMLGAHQFILWVEMFRMQHENFKLLYKVNDYIDLSAHDEWITNICEKLINELNQHVHHEELYDIHLSIYKKSEQQACIQFIIEQINKDVYENLHECLQQLENSLCSFSYSENRLTYDIQIDETIEG